MASPVPVPPPGGFARSLLQPSVQDQFEDAVWLGHLDLAAELLELTDVQINAQSAWNETTLLIRELRGPSREDVVKFLLDNGARLDLADDRGETPLHVAAQNYNAGTVRLLLKHKPPINARDNEGQTPLYLSARHYKQDVTKFSSKREVPISTFQITKEALPLTSVAPLDGMIVPNTCSTEAPTSILPQKRLRPFLCRSLSM